MNAYVERIDEALDTTRETQRKLLAARQRLVPALRAGRLDSVRSCRRLLARVVKGMLDGSIDKSDGTRLTFAINALAKLNYEEAEIDAVERLIEARQSLPENSRPTFSASELYGAETPAESQGDPVPMEVSP